VIGRKKLATIRQELQRALTATGDDPIRWLEERMTAPEHQGPAASGANEVLRSLRRFVEATGRTRNRKGRARVQK
jgi:hypothetical protein